MFNDCFHNNFLDFNVYSLQKTYKLCPSSVPIGANHMQVVGDIFKSCALGQPQNAKNSGYELYILRSTEN
jgi:hypothetical protein